MQTVTPQGINVKTVNILHTSTLTFVYICYADVFPTLYTTQFFILFSLIYIVYIYFAHTYIFITIP
jgi:hypothetical protein